MWICVGLLPSRAKELANRAGMHWTYISAVERGLRNLSLDSMTRLASGLNVSLATLFSVFTRRVLVAPKTPTRTRAKRS